MITVCVKCKHFVNREPYSPRAHCWYNHRCAAYPLPTKPDPYDGREKPYSHNDFGTEVFDSDPLDFCRNHNDGHCSKFTVAHLITVK